MTLKKLLALLLALCLMLPFVFSCTKQPVADDNTETEEDGGNSETDNNNNDESVTATVRDEFGGYDFNGYTFRVLSIDPGAHYYFMLDGDTGHANEVWYEEDDAEVQQHSVFTRNALTEELLNIKTTAIWGGATYDIQDLVKTLVKSGGDDFDMTLGSQCRYLPLAAEGYFLNLLDMETLDLSRDWWDQEYIDTFTYKNAYLYTICGDYNIFDDYATPVVFYNKQVLENYNLDDPADKVVDGTWTIDGMMDYVNAVTSDTSGDGQMTLDDTWGFVDNGQYLFHLSTGCNIHLTALNDEGIPEVTIDSEEFTNAVQSIFDKVTMSGKCYFGDNGDCYDMLKDDRALFYYEILAGINMLRDMESDFSLLPTPKLNDEQKDYGALAQGIYLTVLSVPLSIQDPAKIGVIMQVLGGMSTDTVDAALHEVVLGPKLFREKRTNEMLSYAIENRKYDWAENIPWAYPLMNLIIDQGNAQAFSLASSIQRNLKVLKNSLKRFAIGLEIKQ